MALVSVLAVLLACRSDRPEDQVRRAFDQGRAAVEAGDAAGAAALLAPAFRGPEGMDRATTQLFLLGTLRQDQVGVTVLRNEVAAQGSDVIQEVDLVLTSRSGGALTREVSRRVFRLTWCKLDDGWRLKDAQSL